MTTFSCRFFPLCLVPARATADDLTILISSARRRYLSLFSCSHTSLNGHLRLFLPSRCCCARVDFSWSTVCDCVRMHSTH
jgi:putative lipase involved disintegration of autophagic bodies